MLCLVDGGCGSGGRPVGGGHLSLTAAPCAELEECVHRVDRGGGKREELKEKHTQLNKMLTIGISLLFYIVITFNWEYITAHEWL